MQATAAAVQMIHLLRLSAAVLLIMTLRAAKSLIYGGTDITGWQRALTHVYAVPPLVLLTLLQLSAIFLFARMYHDTPSTIPSKVCSRRSHMVSGKRESSLFLHLCAMQSFPEGLLSSTATLQVSVVSRADVSTNCCNLLDVIVLTQVMGRITAQSDIESGNVLPLLKKVIMVLVPSLLTLYQQLSVARSAAKAVLDGTCVFLFAGMLCHQINEG